VLPLPRAAPDPADVAIVATAAILFAVAVAEPLMQLSDLGQRSTTSLTQSVAAMWLTGSPVAAVLVAICAIVAPALQLTLLAAAGLGGLRSPVPRWATAAARAASVVTPWAMPEVMLLATLVAYVKIAQLAHATPGLGMYATGGVAALLAFARNTADLPTLWSRVSAR
jgi:paraquat-inducible protein A